MECIREQIENREIAELSEFASKSSETKGRLYPYEKCPFRTEYQRDRDKILHSKAFRRLMHKTQVFYSPDNDHYRTRMTHTLEVAQIARTIARALKLNEDLTEAIAIGHDLGHTPFGHSGEAALNEISINGFKHNVQSVRVAEVIEKLNLTQETLDGIKKHTGNEMPFTLEGQAVKISDRIAYLNHDIADTLNAGIITENDIPKDCKDYFKSINPYSEMIIDVIQNSMNKNFVLPSEEGKFYMDKLRSFMFEKVYRNLQVKSEEIKTKHVVKSLFEYYYNLTKENFPEISNNDADTHAKDYVSGMTDRYAILKYKELFIPKNFHFDKKDEYLEKVKLSLTEEIKR